MVANVDADTTCLDERAVHLRVALRFVKRTIANVGQPAAAACSMPVNAPSASNDASGTGYLVGLGYDVYIASMSMSYSSGDLDQETYKAFTFSLGFTF